MLVHLLREAFAARFEPVVNLVFPQMSGRDLLVYLAEQLGAPPADPPRHTVEESVRRLEFFLTQNAIAGQDFDDAQAAYLEAKATAEAARLNLEFTTIRAPVNGKTGPILVQPGNMVAASTASTSATPLVMLNEIQPVKISLSLPQSDLSRGLHFDIEQAAPIDTKCHPKIRGDIGSLGGMRPIVIHCLAIA